MNPPTCAAERVPWRRFGSASAAPKEASSNEPTRTSPCRDRRHRAVRHKYRTNKRSFPMSSTGHCMGDEGPCPANTPKSCPISTLTSTTFQSISAVDQPMAYRALRVPASRVDRGEPQPTDPAVPALRATGSAVPGASIPNTDRRSFLTPQVTRYRR